MKQETEHAPERLAVEKSNEATKKAWQRPQVQKLRISLDTAVGVGSGPDLMSSTRIN